METRRWELSEFGLEHLARQSVTLPDPAPGHVRLAVKAISLNYRDLLVVRGHYNPKLPLPAVPISDAAGVVEAVGDGVTRVAPGDRVMTHFVADWLEGSFRADYLATTLGTPGPGLAADHAILNAEAVLPIPAELGFAAAATLPIAGLTAWSALTTDGGAQPGNTVLTLGTGGVSIFAVQLGRAMGLDVIVTSSSEAKLDKVRGLGATAGINYRSQPAWEREVLARTDGRGADVVVENGGAGTLTQSLRAVRAGGTVAMLGALTGLRAEIDIAPILMKRVRVQGIMVNHRRAFEELLAFVLQHRITPVIEASFGFDELPQALEHMAAGSHFGKIVVVL
ncbi:MAG: NAD(P)-dependent alcohol dehydrogenase [Planctomycetota bacterium]